MGKENLIKRAPVVVVLGHIDSGKTSILDFIRKSHVAEKEAGGITQHIGAYEIEKDGKKITFIDTPGHEAFSQMRARGAKVADIAILVIDSTKGVEAQTKEAISIIRKAQIPFIVALNKIDRPGADPQKSIGELQKEGVLVEEKKGKVPAIKTSAKTGEGIDELLELIILISEIEEIKADLSKPAEGVIIESYLDSRRGPTATLILNNGKLKLGQVIATQSVFGKIKAIEDFRGNSLKEAFPSQPVVIVGFEDCPMVGEKIRVFSSIEEAKNSLKFSEKETRVLSVLPEQKVFNLILKTDVLGSIEPIKEVISQIPQEKIILRILESNVGQINESDVKLAKSSRALILGFRVKETPGARILAEREKIKIMKFDIIYELVEGLRKFIEKMIKPEIKRIDLGKIKTLVIFFTKKNRQIVGGRVIEGEIKKGTKIEIFREKEKIGQGNLLSLQKNKRNIERAGKGEEVGILYEGDKKIEVGDILLIFSEEKEKIEL